MPPVPKAKLKSKSDGVIIQSVERALKILECFYENEELGISQISEYMMLSKSTVFGIVNTLAAFGYLEQVESKKYRLGIRLFEFGNLMEKRMDLRTEARPFIEAIAEKYRQTVHLSTHYEGEVVYIDKVDTPDFIVFYSQVGRRAPMTCTGVGKAMLAYLPNEYIEKYILKNEFAMRTENSIGNKEELMKDLELVRRRKYAVDDEEIDLGLRCVAAPIFDRNNSVVAAVSLSGTSARMEKDNIEEISKDIIYCAQEISRRLGCMK